MNIVAGIIALINPHAKTALVGGLLVVAAALLATYAKDIVRLVTKAK